MKEITQCPLPPSYKILNTILIAPNYILLYLLCLTLLTIIWYLITNLIIQFAFKMSFKLESLLHCSAATVQLLSIVTDPRHVTDYPHYGWTKCVFSGCSYTRQRGRINDTENFYPRGLFLCVPWKTKNDWIN